MFSLKIEIRRGGKTDSKKRFTANKVEGKGRGGIKGTYTNGSTAPGTAGLGLCRAGFFTQGQTFLCFPGSSAAVQRCRCRAELFGECRKRNFKLI